VRRRAREDYLIKSYDVHEESVYSVAWGCYEASPYVFASLSYDGRVVINQVRDTLSSLSLPSLSTLITCDYVGAGARGRDRPHSR
jgi:hypothetical protein